MSGNAPRALRCANPGNLRRSEDKWQGLADAQDDPEFFTFKSPKWGFRAMAVLLINYQDKHDLHTISGIIHRWAPETENDTTSYIHRVCEMTGFAAAELLDLHKYTDIAPIVKSIASVECGGWLFDNRDMDAGLRMAGVESPVPSLRTSRTVRAGTLAAGTTTATGVMDQLQDIQTPLYSLAPYVRWAEFALAGITLLSVGYMIYARIDDHARAVR